MIDFSSCKLSNRYYGGSEKKIGIIFNDDFYMLKFKKNTPFGKRNNHFSEYIGSQIFNLCGINCQTTYLGTYKNEYVVACKDFTSLSSIFVPFNDIGESTIETDKEKYKYSYDDIIHLLNSNKKITNIDNVISIFFDMYIVDAFIGNFDRHGLNWGFIKKDNKYFMAPIFDNGSCLFPNLINEDQIKMILSNQEEINERIYKFPTSQILLNGNKSSYYEVISSLEYEECNKALIRIYNRINLEEINNMIDNIENASLLLKEFYKTMLKERYEKIIKYSYFKLIGKQNGK